MDDFDDPTEGSQRLLARTLRCFGGAWRLSLRILATEQERHPFYSRYLRDFWGVRRRSRTLPTPLLRVGWWHGGDDGPAASHGWRKGERYCVAVELYRGFDLYLMWNGEILRHHRTPPLPGGIKRKAVELESGEEHDNHCMHCQTACRPETARFFICCEGCRRTCCHACSITIDPHADKAVQTFDDWWCTECRRTVEATGIESACGEGVCDCCSLEFDRLCRSGVRLKLFHKEDGWIAGCKVKKFVPAHTPDASGNTYPQSWWYIDVPGHPKAPPFELVQGGHFFEGGDEPFTAGWQLE